MTAAATAKILNNIMIRSSCGVGAASAMATFLQAADAFYHAHLLWVHSISAITAACLLVHTHLAA
jgi:hypothetical protein